MKQELTELCHYRELLYMLTYRDIKVRYKQSVMGLLWAVLMPILIVSAGIVIRYAYALASGKPLVTGAIASVAVKSLPWAFLASSIRFSCNSLINNQNLVTEVFPVAAVLASFFDLLIASGALVLFLLAVRIGWSVQLVWVPILLLAMTVMTVGIAIILSAASLFFRDVKYVVEVLITFGIFFTPVLFDVQMFGEKGKWLLLNPAAPILEGFSACIVHHQLPNLPWLMYSFIFGLTVLCGGYAFFKRLEPNFAEYI